MNPPDVPRVSRRSALIALAASVPLASCGFRLRGQARFNFHSIKLGFTQRSPMGAELRRQLATLPDVRIVEAEKDAEVVLDVLDDRVSRAVSATTSVGQVREFNITTHLRFRLRTPAGRELIGATELALSTPLTYNETDALAKEYEESERVADMRRDIAAQVVRRLEAVKL